MCGGIQGWGHPDDSDGPYGSGGTPCSTVARGVGGGRERRLYTTVAPESVILDYEYRVINLGVFYPKVLILKYHVDNNLGCKLGELGYNYIMTIAQILADYGPWGIAALAIMGMIKLYADQRALQKSMGKVLDQRYTEYTQVVQSTHKTLIRVSEAMERVTTVLGAVNTCLTDTERSLTVNKEVIERAQRAAEALERRGWSTRGE